MWLISGFKNAQTSVKLIDKYFLNPDCIKMSGTSVVPYTQGKKPTVLPAIDAYHESVPPLDYSFMHLSAVQELYEEEPRVYNLKKSEASPRETKDKKCKGQCLRLNNNRLSDISLMCEVVNNRFSNPMSLGWIDLSFNELTDIDPIILTFENLEILYLHGNQIDKLQEVDKLQGLTKLRKLTLHGNPVEEIKGYKQYILSLMPWLLALDFFRITKADQKTAETWNRMSNKMKHKKKEKCKRLTVHVT